MDAGTDRLGLTNRKLFEILRGTLDPRNVQTRNIIECHDDILYVWNSSDSSVMTLNTKTMPDDPEEQDFQTLLPTDPPFFAVHQLLVNGTSSLLAAVGPRGVALLDLPRRWGRAAAFHGGKSNVSCRCHILDEHFFVCNPKVEVRRVRWHPGSAADPHLVVLMSDNTMRLYVTGADPRLVHIWPLGRQPGRNITPTANLSLMAGLGDTAVDFDFTPPVLKENADDTTSPNATADLLWPILVLRGNGVIYSLTASLTQPNTEKPHLLGPLSMYPFAADNYGVDACSLLCLQTEPAVVVMATCSGMLYHAALLPEDPEASISRGSSAAAPDMGLFVFESAELELGLSLADSDPAYSCPIQLYRDVTTTSRYFASHDMGVHVLSLPFVLELEKFLNVSDDECSLQLPSLDQGSTAEYLICTRASTTSPASPLLGLTLTTTPATLVVLIASGEVVSLPLATVLLAPSQPHPEPRGVLNSSPLKMMLKEPFETHIQMLLKHSITQPILKLGPGANPSPQECLELVGRTTQIFREEYFQRHNRVREEIERRVRTLRSMKEHQQRELGQLELETKLLKGSAESLAEKYEDTKDKQEELTKRTENLLRLVSRQQPVISTAERKFGRELRETKDLVEHFGHVLHQIKSKQTFQKVQMEQWVSHQKKKNIHLGDNQQRTIQANLRQVTIGISDLKMLVEEMKKELAL